MKRLLLLTLLTTGVVHAHSAPHITRFIATDGIDQGNCDQAQSPCKSLAFALAKSSKGDSIKLAQGDYHLKGDTRFAVLSGAISVEGGYSRRDQFAQQSSQNVTLLSGVPGEYAVALQRKGFETLQDSKAADFAFSKDEQKQFAAFRKMTEKVEGEAACINGKAGVYSCNKMDLLSHIPLSQFSKPAGEANDIWGFVDKNDNHEYIIVGLDVGTAVVDVTDPKHPREVTTIGGVVNDWRDIAVYQFFDKTANRWKSYAYITSEGVQGLQILDLTGLPNTVRDAGTISTYFSRAHTLYINTDYAYGTTVTGLTPTLYIAGANVNGGSWQALDLIDPLLPKQIFQRSGAARSDYMHDATGMLITDSRTSQCAAGHNPCEVLFDYNEKSLVIWDTTDKSNPVKLSDTPYTQVGYTHSGWYSKDKMYLFLNDELDEPNLGIPTALRTFDISNLKAPTVVAKFDGPTHAIDHNTYTIGDRSYISHYRRGVVMMDVNDPVHISEEAFFDTSAAFSDDAANFNGAWGVYPFLPSGTVGVSDLEGGLYMVRYNEPVVALKETTLTVKESAGNISVNVLRRGNTSQPLSVNYATQTDSANDSDFNASTGTLSWTAGETAEKTISVAINSDTTAELAERFAIRLNTPSTGASIGQHETIVSIIDKLAGRIGFSVANIAVSEEAGSATVTVSRIDGADGAVSVDYQTQNDSANADDFSAKNGTLNWADGDSADKTITIALTDDSLKEGDESFNIVLSNVSGGASPASILAKVTITASDSSGGSGGGAVEWMFLLTSLTLCYRRNRQS